jgi:GNAT superfamily N-acetyltransferase
MGLPMDIIQAKSTDLIEILYLLRICIQDMNAKGQKHWNNCVPSVDDIQLDLDKGFIYLIKDKGVCKGMITLNEQEPEDYKKLSFNSSGKKPLFLQNIAVHPRWQGMGIATQLVNFAQQVAREKGYDCLRLDVFKPSDKARQLCEKQLFKEVASFHSAFQQIPFVCYEKQV